MVGAAEFGFLVIGKEFDSYPKKMIRDIKNWNWFIENPRMDNEGDDDEELEEKKKRRRKRKNRREENEDEEWTGESDEEKEQFANTRKVQRPKKYITRSRDRHETSKDINTVSNVNVKRIEDEEEDEDEDEEEDDETLGGFIVDDDDIVEEEANEIEEEEEEGEDEEDEFHD